MIGDVELSSILNPKTTPINDFVAKCRQNPAKYVDFNLTQLKSGNFIGSYLDPERENKLALAIYDSDLMKFVRFFFQKSKKA